MPGKRSKRNKVQHFYCPYCEHRLWRLGSPKHFLFYLGAAEIKQNVGMSSKSAALLAARGDYLDNNSWIEDFFCRDHGKLWMKITRKDGGKLVSAMATSIDWRQTTRTIMPHSPNPSVSEFTYRMSRQSGVRYYEK
ncbi:MAG: hypothetical protein JOZ78_08220 [Chroococcidiopsidaceae cyanobacterium CP_BM_ER_R8_30]|nr:hypothetical protein [Chroococcidiopsidaceae cyanobacterium CP_BM_ER_R8_30]